MREGELITRTSRGKESEAVRRRVNKSDVESLDYESVRSSGGGVSGSGKEDQDCLVGEGRRVS